MIEYFIPIKTTEHFVRIKTIVNELLFKNNFLNSVIINKDFFFFCYNFTFNSIFPHIYRFYPFNGKFQMP